MTNARIWPKSIRALVLAVVVIVSSSLIVVAAELAVRVRHWMKHDTLWTIEGTYMIDPASAVSLAWQLHWNDYPLIARKMLLQEIACGM